MADSQPSVVNRQSSIVNHQSSAGEFSYRPVPVMAPATLVLGILSVIALAALAGLGVCVFGMVLGFVCLRKIRRSRGELGGRLLATMGFWLSVVFLVWGSVLHAHTYRTELPEGYRRINFTQDISKKGFVDKDGKTQIHPDVKSLENQKIFVKGYMYPTGQMKGITAFWLVKDNQACCFGGQPALNDVIQVRMRKGKTVEDKRGLVAVGGMLQIADTFHRGQTAPVYELEGTHFGVARTSF